MTQESAHHPSGPLVVAMALASVAGFVDAHVYLHVAPVFVANMSGNLVRLGMDAGNGSWREASGAALAIAAFSVGVVVAVVQHDRRRSRSLGLRPGGLLAGEAILLLAVAVLRIWHDAGFHPVVSARNAPIIVVAGLAMGVQAAALRRVGSIAVATTYGTGAIVRIGEKVALAGRRSSHAVLPRRHVTIVVLVSVLLGYVGGAVVSAVVGSSAWLMAGPVAVLVVAAVVLDRTSIGRKGSAAIFG